MENMNRKTAKIVLNNVVNTLPVKYRQHAIDILSIKYLAQNSVQETAAILGLPVNYVNSVLHAVKMTAKGKTISNFATA